MSNEEEGMCETQDLTSDMSDDHQVYSAEYKDGQLHIVEVSPYHKGEEAENQLQYEQESILPTSDGDEQPKYLQLDLLNFTVLKNADGTNTYHMVSSDGVTTNNGDTTITCVLSNDDDDGNGDNQDSYVMLDTDYEQDPYIYLRTTQPDPVPEPSEIEAASSKSKDKLKQLTPVQILEKAKALQKAKAFLVSSTATKSRRGRKRKSDLPPPMELLNSPNFKLYLYSCKQCTFKCNAVKEMSAHKKTKHPAGCKGSMGGLQCAHCPFRGHTHRQLMHHVTRTHAKFAQRNEEFITALQLDSEEVEAADVLVCGACGFESGDRALFKKHIEDEHGAITSLK